MLKNLLSLLLSLTTTFSTFSQVEAITKEGRKVLLHEDGTWTYAPEQVADVVINPLEIPRLKKEEKVVKHMAFALSYNEIYEQANWVAYELTGEETNAVVKRGDQFIVDPDIETATANDNDYAGSGYDRGHLAPSADMCWSATSMEECFYYSNMSPQVPAFNRGIWKQAEELVRTWAREYQSIYVVTGPVLTAGLTTIGSNAVGVPKYYYKVVLDYRKPGGKGIAFLMPNAGSKQPLQSFAVSIDSAEKFTGMDFFPALPDKEEKAIEQQLDVNAWAWKKAISKPE
jgi:endonuclease G